MLTEESPETERERERKGVIGGGAEGLPVFWTYKTSLPPPLQALSSPNSQHTDRMDETRVHSS